MITQSEKRFNEDYKLLRILVLTKRVTVEKAKNWIRVRGNRAFIDVGDEVISDKMKELWKSQSKFEKDLLKEFNED